MRWLSVWAVAIVGTAVLSASGCLTSQEDPNGDNRLEDPPVTRGNGGSAGTNGRGGDAGEETGGTRNRGGSGGTAGSGNGEGGSDGGCSEDDDCSARLDGRSRCSVPSGECVACLAPADCQTDEECVNNTCRSILACATSSECPRGLVCNTATDRCVECIGATGCATGELCVGNTCRMTCTTDSQCILFGMRCNTSAGYCASCVEHNDCPATQHCENGSCARDTCVPGSATCDGNSLATCNDEGSGVDYPVPCAPRSTCTEDASGARCEPWVCQPSTTGCSLTSERLVTCSADGLTETVIEDCEAADQLCIGTGNTSMCSDAVCEPSLLFCDGATVQLCDSTGTSYSLYQSCSSNQRCNPQTLMCAVPLCTPGQPACDGNVYTTCNAEGFGYTGTRTDCSATERFCGSSGCTDSAVDTIPASPTLYTSGALPSYLMVNFYSVTSPRTLSRIEQYMSPDSAMTLTWHVYESLTQTGAYTSISNTTTTSTTGVGYQASGALAVPLVAGRFYAIGVSWTTPSLLFGYQQASATQALSFGALFGGGFYTPPPSGTISGSTASTSAFVPQRLTTAP